MSSKKNKLLAGLARFDHPKIKAALDKKINAVGHILNESDSYQELSDSLDKLETIAVQNPDKVIDILGNTLKRLDEIKINMPVIEEISPEKIARLFTKQDLKIKILDIIALLKYRDGKKVVNYLFDFAASADEKIKSKAVESLREYSNYTIRIYYGSDQSKKLLAEPQEIILEKIKSLNNEQQLKHFDLIVALCGCILSPTMHDSKWSYSSVEMITSAIPDSVEIKNIRRTTLSYLFNLYSVAKELNKKRDILNTIDVASRVPAIKIDEAYEKTKSMVLENIIDILNFYLRILPEGALSNLLIIEDDARRIYINHSAYEPIKKIAYEVKHRLESNEEYTIYKNLMSYNDSIVDWDSKKTKTFNPDDLKELRKNKFEEYIESINDENFSLWKGRILLFSNTLSNDLATFMNLDHFLEMLSSKVPQFAIRLLDVDLNGRLVPIIKALWSTDYNGQVKAILTKWINENKNLDYIASVFVDGKVIDKEILNALLKKAINLKNINTLALLMCTVVDVDNDNERSELVKEIFIPSLKEFVVLKDPRWINVIWFRKGLPRLISELEPETQQLILDSVLFAGSIDHHIECVLVPIAKKSPEKIAGLFLSRIKYQDKANADYNAIPYDFYELDKVLTEYPNVILNSIFTWDEDLFDKYGARLISIIFTEFSKQFADALFGFIRTTDKDKIIRVLKIIEKFNDSDNIFEIAKEILKHSQDNEMIIRKVKSLFYSVGVTQGEYGLAEEFERRQQIVKDWQNNENGLVKKFAKELYTKLGESAVSERKRAEEEIELRKQQYGVNDEDKI